MSTVRAGRCSRSRYFCIAKAHGREVPADVRDDRALPPVSIPSEALDDAVWEHVSLILNRPEYVQQMIARLEADDRTDLDLAALVACGTKVRIELENYAMAISAASSPPVVATLTAKMYELDSTLDEIEREHDRISQERAKVRAHIGELKAVYADAGRTRSQMTYEMRRRTLTSLGLQVYVEPRCTRRSHAMPRYRIEMALIDVAAEMTNDGRSVSLTQLSIDEPLSVTFAV